MEKYHKGFCNFECFCRQKLNKKESNGNKLRAALFVGRMLSMRPVLDSVLC